MWDPDDYDKCILSEAMLIKALSDPEEFKRLIEYNYDLITAATLFPQHAEKLIAKVMSDPEEFKRLIDYNIYLISTAKHFPQHAEALIAKVIDDPAEFKRLITNDAELQDTAKQFPNQPILQAASYEQALEMVIQRINDINKNLSQVGVASSALGQGKRDTDNPFYWFPKDVLIKIAKDTADEGVLSDDQAHRKATEIFEHPLNRKK